MSFWPKLAGIVGASGVAMGAYGSHGFSPADAHFEKTFKRANEQQMYHAALLAAVQYSRRPYVTGSLAFVGVLLFSGSCYVAALTEDRSYGKLAPFGGVCLMAAWLTLLL